MKRMEVLPRGPRFWLVIGAGGVGRGRERESHAHARMHAGGS